MQNFSKAAVIGAGSMGAGIAAHLANAGIEVLLLDVPTQDSDRNSRAEEGIARQVKRRGFMREEFSKRVVAGNIDDDLHQLADVDWVIEAIIENPDAKRDLYAKVAPYLGDNAILSSNTSTIPLAELIRDLDQSQRSRFAIVHFFNPPRTMRLVELVTNNETKAQVIDTLEFVCEQQLGKVVLHCRDTPGFIANRIGNLWMAVGAHMALNNNVKFEDADKVFAQPFGIPRTGIFGLFDYIGLQLVPGIWGSLESALPETDAYNRYPVSTHPIFQGLLERGFTGRTGPSGFYRGRDEVLTEDFHYRPHHLSDDPALLKKSAREVMETDSPAGRFARDTFLETLRYACEVAEEIAESVNDIDIAMEQGYGWKKGPFALADSIGLEWISQHFDDAPELFNRALKNGGFYPQPGHALLSTGETAAVRKRTGVITLADAIEDSKTVFSNDGLNVHLRPDGIAIINLKTPLNSCSRDVLNGIGNIAEHGESWGIRAAVIGNDEARAFCAGADLATLAALSAEGDVEKLQKLFTQGREVFAALNRAPFPVVAAARGVALGGGAELLLHCNAMVISAESKIGFPERNVGLIPAWGGTIRMLEAAIRSKAADPLQTAYEFIMSATPTTSAFDARARGLVSEDDQILLSPDHVLGAAITLASTLKGTYQVAPHSTFDLSHSVSNPADTWEKGQNGTISPTDQRLAHALAKVYFSTNTSEVTERELGQREALEAAIVLTHPDNAARAEHMARTRKPLKN